MAFLIGAILDEIKAMGMSLRSLRDVEFEFDADQRPIFHVGNSAIVFRVRYDGELCALRCYTRPKPYLREIYGEQYYPNSFFIFNDGRPKPVNVVLCRWVEGEVLGCVVKRALEQRDHKTLSRLSASFDRLAERMLQRHDWAHGDLSGRNIIVKEDFEMELIDHDSNFVEALSGCESSEVGTPAYQSPLRTKKLFSADMDDISIAIISVSLKALSIDPTLVDRYPVDDGLLINGVMILNQRYKLLQDITSLLAMSGEFAAYRMARALSRYELHIEGLQSLISFSTRQTRDNDQTIKREAPQDIELFEKMGVWGYHNSTTEEVITPPLYDEAFEYRGDEALVRVVRWWFYVDRRGGVVASAGEWLESKPPLSRQRNRCR